MLKMIVTIFLVITFWNSFHHLLRRTLVRSVILFIFFQRAKARCYSHFIPPEQILHLPLTIHHSRSSAPQFRNLLRAIFQKLYIIIAECVCFLTLHIDRPYYLLTGFVKNRHYYF